jgi:hypothetical protein
MQRGKEQLNLKIALRNTSILLKRSWTHLRTLRKSQLKNNVTPSKTNLMRQLKLLKDSVLCCMLNPMLMVRMILVNHMKMLIKKVAEGSQNRICMSSPYNQSSIAFEKRSIHISVSSLDQVGDLPMNVSPACSEYASTKKKEIGEKHQEEAITGDGTRYKTVSLDTDTASLVLDKIVDSSICLNHRRLQNYCSDETEKKNQSHICNRDRMVLLAEQTVVDDAVQNDRVYSGDAKLKKCPVKNPTAEMQN